ncbi:M48 family metallopeptidase [Jiulongibacter sediminis]|jgi:predicted Zn-dependent protease|uniref:Peptidase M48 n=1 Tax=Jiulongibacter sediminis TaxID=1605367 RepID=A0A0P7BX94_9BACT|nr:M48 family metallopeptidase [Jiulongibacter sediminis]KPM49535.1 peptidase M48 [Jiulongibacter sediminis]TBX26577.1 peptidase M48 [Jiulongibacter sediminis]
MNTFKKIFIALVGIGFVILSCQRVPITGRKQFVGLVSSDQMLQLSFAQYDGFMDTSKVVSTRQKEGAMVARVGSRIKKAVEDYLIANNYSEVIDGYQWQFNTVENDQLNAWCMPGGKVCFYTGILPICQNDEGIAVVMGHEIAHAIAEHGRERMSRAMAANGITQVGAVAAGIATKSEDVMQVAGQVLGIGTQVGGVLPNSRKQESEADNLGLIFMAMAGYNPQEGVAFWQRMQKAGEGSQKPPLILSTHPADDQRIADMEKMMPKAMKYYYAYGGQ